MLAKYESKLSHSSKYRKVQPFILNHTFCVRMLTKYEGNLPTEHKWMHKVTQQEVEKKQPFVLNHTSCVRMLIKYESNLPT